MKREMIAYLMMVAPARQRSKGSLTHGRLSCGANLQHETIIVVIGINQHDTRCCKR